MIHEVVNTISLCPRLRAQRNLASKFIGGKAYIINIILRLRLKYKYDIIINKLPLIVLPIYILLKPGLKPHNLCTDYISQRPKIWLTILKYQHKKRRFVDILLLENINVSF